MNKDIDDYINHAPEDQGIIMQKIRELIQASVPGVKENLKWGRPVFSVDKDFTYIKTAKGYVTLGFFDFHQLEDPKQLLQGTGKDMRHIKLKKVTDIDNELLKKWFTVLVK
jgi:hypothetical protein